jgi:SAM-dependent methyltransferase
MDRYVEANRARWDELVAVHTASAFYDLAAFKAGRCSLMPIEVEALGDVRGKSLLHLQCHFGQDTLSWARRGAIVTGVDFSGAAIRTAQELAQELKIPATFIESDVLALRTQLSAQFEIVFTSYGVLGWLPDLDRWAQTIADSLRPGGTFLIVEIHPTAYIFTSDGSAEGLRVRWPYFEQTPLHDEEEGSYADPHATVQNRVSYWWVHTFSDVINALLRVGLRLESTGEYPMSVCAVIPGMKQSADRYYRLPEGAVAIPQLFSIKATKP